MDDKKIKAEALLDAIGEIDDSYLVGAVAYKKRRRSLAKVLVIAATLILTMAILFSTVIGASVVGLFMLLNDPPQNSEEQDEQPMDDKLSFLMVGLSDSSRFTFCESERDIPYANGNAYIVWQYEGEDGYYMSDELSGSEVDALKSRIGRGKQVGDGSPTLRCKVWLLLEDGRVISPYLKASAGNTSNAIFDYEAEIIPDDALVDQISDILS